MNHYKVTAPKDGGTVMFLGVFGPGEERVFTEDEIKQFEGLGGVKVASALPEGYRIEKSSAKAKEETEAKKAEADRDQQEKNAAALQKQAVPGDTDEKSEDK
jgi:hypothetical protein